MEEYEDGGRSSKRLAAKNIVKRPVTDDHGGKSKRAKTKNKNSTKSNGPFIGDTVDETKHLSVFNYQLPKFSSDGNEIEEESEYESDNSYKKVLGDLRAGDVVLYFQYPAGHMQLSGLSWSRVVSITSKEDDDGDMTADVMLSNEFDYIDYESNRIAVYRHDEKGVLQDITAGGFVGMSSLHLIDGSMDRGTYATQVDKARAVFRRSEDNLNRKLVEEGMINSAEDGVSLGITQSGTKEDSVLTKVMACIIAQFEKNVKETHALREKNRELREQLKLAADIGPEAKGETIILFLFYLQRMRW